MAQQRGFFLDPPAKSVRVEKDVDILYAAREAKSLAFDIGLSPRQATSIEIAVSELASNLLRYARWGIIDLKALKFPAGIEIAARDWGPGMNDLQAALEGLETDPKGLGIGLSGVQRLMDEIEIESVPDSGTIIHARKWLYPRVSQASSPATSIKYVVPVSGVACSIAAVGRPRPGHTVSGDAYVVRALNGLLLVAVIDGLGHGTGAHEIGRTAVDFLRAQPL